MKKATLFQSLRRTLVAAVLMFSTVAGLNAQNGPCNNPPNCIVNNHVGAAGGYGDMNSTAATTIAGWYPSHGDPTTFGNDCPTSSNNYSIWMWSYLHVSGTQQGEGVYTCYNFQAGRTYTVCLWVRNTNGVNNGGRLRVLAANGLTNTGPTSWSPIATPTSSQLIANSWANNQTWTQVTYTFTANANYAELWIYPFMAANPVNGQQYELQIDDIRVTQGAVQPGQLGISASPPVIDWCQSSTLSISGAPAGTTVTWSPSTGLSSTSGLSVSASPCATTTYTATVVVPGGNPNCPSCGISGTFVLTQQVIVNQPSFQIVGNPNVQCGEMIELDAVPGYFCSNVTYSWTGPNGFAQVGPHASIGPANATHGGTYTVQITNANGGCSYIAQIDVTVQCPCEAKPDFHWDGCNPINFYGVNNGGSPVVAWFWEFGDGQTSTQQNPTHYYAAGGSYKVCLTILATNNHGETCCERICYEVEVCPPGPCHVIPNFGVEVDYASQTAYFTDLSTGTGVACDWRWDFGDGNFASGIQNPVHSYGGPGFYYVCLTVTFCIYDPNTGELIDKCSETYCQWITVDQQFSLRQAGKGAPRGDDMVKVFPNPASNELFIAATEFLQPTVRVMSVTGQEVSRATISGKNLYRVDVSTLAPGLYMVEVLYPDGTAKHVQFVKD
jgi:hypothetical protein